MATSLQRTSRQMTELPRGHRVGGLPTRRCFPSQLRLWVILGGKKSLLGSHLGHLILSLINMIYGSHCTPGCQAHSSSIFILLDQKMAEWQDYTSQNSLREREVYTRCSLPSSGKQGKEVILNIAESHTLLQQPRGIHRFYGAQNLYSVFRSWSGLFRKKNIKKWLRNC